MIKNFALLAVSALAALILGELVCRLVYSPIDREMSTFRVIRESAYQDDAELGWVPKPSFHGEHRLPHDQVSSFSTNSLGLRGSEIDPKRHAGVQRIAVAGDSFAWGWGVDDGDDFPDQLMSGRSDREVFNLGVINFNTFQEEKYFERVGVPLQPDIVLLAFCLNDVVGATYDFLAPRPAPRPQNSSGASGLHGVRVAIAQHSAMYGLINDVVTSNRGLMRLAVSLGIKDELDGYDALDYNLRPFLKDYPPELTQQWNAALAQVRAFKAVADDLHIRFILVVIPALQSVSHEAFEASLATSKYSPSDFDMNRPYAALANFARENSLEFVDPTPLFRESAARGETLYLIGDQHFNREGHRLFAKAIRDHLDAAKS